MQEIVEEFDFIAKKIKRSIQLIQSGETVKAAFILGYLYSRCLETSRVSSENDVQNCTDCC